MAEDLKEFEDQLQQEEIAKQTEQSWGYGSQYYQDEDGTFYEFDADRKAWVPMINDDFIAQYNLNYGTYTDPSTSVSTDAAQSTSDPSSSCASSTENKPQHEEESTSNDKRNEPLDKSKKKRPTPQEPAWFEIQEEKNTNVYVTGLPNDIKDEEYLELMNKVGLVASDPITRKLKLKLYKNPDGSYKGDGRCCYLKPESVDLALSILDGSNVRGNIISVERAKFEMKGQYDPSKKRRKLTKQEKKKAEEKQKWLLGWEPEKKADGRPHWEKTVVIKNAFLPNQFEEAADLLLELTDDFREECKKFGEVKKVLVCDRHEEGVVLVTFKTPEEADACILAVHRRWFGGRQLEASTYDGRTKYYVKETEEEKESRLKKWNEYLQKGESSSKPAEAPGESKIESKIESKDDQNLVEHGLENLETSTEQVSTESGSQESLSVSCNVNDVECREGKSSDSKNDILKSSEIS